MTRKTKIRQPNKNDYKVMFEAACVLADEWKAKAESLDKQLVDMADFFFKHWPRSHREELKKALKERLERTEP